jgi:hypothetical protein
MLKRMTLGLAIAAAGCTRPQSSPRPEPTRTYLVIDNQSFVDHRIYVMNGSSRLRMGFAPGKHATKMQIPVQVVTGSHLLVFIAEPMGGNSAARSEEIYVNEGDEVHLMIPPF